MKRPGLADLPLHGGRTELGAEWSYDLRIDHRALLIDGDLELHVVLPAFSPRADSG